MALLIIVVILAGILVVIAGIQSARSSSPARRIPARPNEGDNETAPLPVEVNVNVSGLGGDPSDPPDVGPVTPSGDGGWIINPKTSFPLTLYNGDRQTIESVRQVLQEEDQWYLNQANLLTSLIAQQNIRCQEIDAYVHTYRPLYRKHIEDAKRASLEWPDASAPDQADLLMEFRKQAIAALDVRPAIANRDVETLFDGEPDDITVDDALLERFGADVVQLYLRYATDLTKVRKVPASHADRKGFEALVERRLAIRGSAIPAEDVLTTLRLKDMRELVADLDAPKFSRKAKAIEYLSTLPDLGERLGKAVAFRELFQLQPLPGEFAHIDLQHVAEAWAYARVTATIVALTYSMSVDYVVYEDARGYEIRGAEQCCPHCERAAERPYKTPPVTPLHIACRCRLRSLWE